MAEEYFKQLELIMLPMSRRFRLFNDDFLLMDNLPDDRLVMYPEAESIITYPYPFRINFTVCIFCLSGSLRLRLNLVEQTVCKNNVLIVVPGTIGQCIEISSDFKVAVLAFSNDSYNPNQESGVLMTFAKFLSKKNILELTDEQVAEFVSLYSSVFDKLSDEGYLLKKEMIKAYMQVMFCSFYQCMHPLVSVDDELLTNRKKQIFDRFLVLVRENFRKERSIKFYADKLCFTPKYLSQVILEESGRRAAEWIKSYVILEAKVLLKSKQYSIQQVSDMLSFPNQSFFGTFFKKYTGYSPSAYQEM